MKELLSTINDWLAAEKKFALATVVNTWGSAPRPVGSHMIISDDMDMAGSVSGGCVENAVVKAAQEVIQSGQARKLAFGVTDEEAWEVGLSCGGKIQVFVEPFPAFAKTESPLWSKMYQYLIADQGFALLTHLTEGETKHLLYQPDNKTVGGLNSDALRQAAKTAYEQRSSQTVEVDGESYFARVFPRRSQLLIIGAAHITADLVQLAQQFDFETIVIDPRGIFTEKTTFPVPSDQLFEDYPAEILSNFTLDAYTYAAVLSHDPKIDDQALHILLRSKAAYIGALGGRKSQEKRRKRLLEAGFSAEDVQRIHGPIGVDINAKTPREIALSILAEVIMIQNKNQ